MQASSCPRRRAGRAAAAVCRAQAAQQCRRPGRGGGHRSTECGGGGGGIGAGPARPLSGRGSARGGGGGRDSADLLGAPRLQSIGMDTDPGLGGTRAESVRRAVLLQPSRRRLSWERAGWVGGGKQMLNKVQCPVHGAGTVYRRLRPREIPESLCCSAAAAALLHTAVRCRWLFCGLRSESDLAGLKFRLNA